MVGLVDKSLSLAHLYILRVVVETRRPRILLASPSPYRVNKRTRRDFEGHYRMQNTRTHGKPSGRVGS